MLQDVYSGKMRTILCAAWLGLVLVGAGCALSSHGGHPSGRLDQNTAIDPTGSIGGIRAGETRPAAERVLGAGTQLSESTGRNSTGAYKLERVSYRTSGLVLVYTQAADGPAQVFAVYTASRRYRTPGGLGVGSTLKVAEHTRGIQCSAQLAQFVCEGGLGYEKPVTVFDVRHDRVYRVFLAAAAD
jgi:hypothetical protein